MCDEVLSPVWVVRIPEYRRTAALFPENYCISGQALEINGITYIGRIRHYDLLSHVARSLDIRAQDLAQQRIRHGYVRYYVCADRYEYEWDSWWNE